MGGYSARLYGLLRHRPCVVDAGRLQCRVLNATGVDRPPGLDALDDIPPEGGSPLGRGCDDVPELLAGLVTRGPRFLRDGPAGAEEPASGSSQEHRRPLMPR